jgi:hypothetical protein
MGGIQIRYNFDKDISSLVFSESCDPPELISRSQFEVRWDSSIVFGSKTFHLERHVGDKEQFGGLGLKCFELASNLGGHTHRQHFIFQQKRWPYILLQDHFTLIKFCSLIEYLSRPDSYFDPHVTLNLRHPNLLHAISKSDLNVKNIPQLPQIEPIQPIMAKKGTQLAIYLSCAFEI